MGRVVWNHIIAAEISEGFITPAHVAYLRKKFYVCEISIMHFTNCKRVLQTSVSAMWFCPGQRRNRLFLRCIS